MAYDSSRQVIVMFGGRDAAGNPLNDTWEYDGNTRIQVFPEVSPTAREQHTMTYDLARQRVVLFGGARNPGGVGGDTWEYGVRTR